jgi:hypothetical protein
MGSPADDATPTGVLGQRRSRSADEAWRDECQRIAAMTVRERIELALALGLELDALFPASATDP